jgi:hypothetical protein
VRNLVDVLITITNCSYNSNKMLLKLTNIQILLLQNTYHCNVTCTDGQYKVTALHVSVRANHLQEGHTESTSGCRYLKYASLKKFVEYNRNV